MPTMAILESVPGFIMAAPARPTDSLFGDATGLNSQCENVGPPDPDFGQHRLATVRPKAESCVLIGYSYMYAINRAR